MKKCSCCKKVKELKEFAKDKNRKDNLYPFCRECVHKLYKKNKFKIQKRIKLYYLKNRLKILAYVKSWIEKNKESVLRKKREYYHKNKKELQRKHKKYRDSHKKELALYFRLKRKKDINFKIAQSLRNRIGMALKQNNKKSSTHKLLGCSISELKTYLENQFQEGMSWENYGRKKGKKCWEIDHIIPCAKFDLSKFSQQFECFNYQNLQPLWRKENMSKGSK